MFGLGGKIFTQLSRTKMRDFVIIKKDTLEKLYVVKTGKITFL